MATDGYVGLPADSTGKKLRTFEVTTTPGTVEQQVVVIADPTTVANYLQPNADGSLDVNLSSSQGSQASSTGTLSASEAISATGTTNTTAHVVCNVGTSGNATIILSGGTYTNLQLGFEGSPDGTNWFSIDATRSDGSGVDMGLTGTYTAAAVRAWNITCPGYTYIRARANALTETVAPTILIVPGPFLYDPSPTVAPVDGCKPTFVTSVAAMSTTIASDIFVLTGSASKIIRVTRVEIYCVAGAATTTTWSLIKRSTVDTSGTTSASTQVPLDSAFTATATSTGYTVAPTLGNSVGPIRTWRGSVATTGTGITWDFGNRPSMAPVLRGTTQQLAINNGTAIGTSGSWNICVEWTEE